MPPFHAHYMYFEGKGLVIDFLHPIRMTTKVDLFQISPEQEKQTLIYIQENKSMVHIGALFP